MRTYIIQMILQKQYFILLSLIYFHITALSTVVSSWLAPIVYIYDYDMNVVGRSLPDMGHKLWKLILNYCKFEKDYIDAPWLPDRFVEFTVLQTFIFLVLHPRRLQIVRRYIHILMFTPVIISSH